MPSPSLTPRAQRVDALSAARTSACGCAGGGKEGLAMEPKQMEILYREQIRAEIVDYHERVGAEIVRTLHGEPKRKRKERGKENKE